MIPGSNPGLNIFAITSSIFIYAPKASLTNMIITTVASYLRRLTSYARAAFSSTHNQLRRGNEHEEPEITKHNPERSKDLRGFEHLDKLNEVEKSYSPIHSQEPSFFSAAELFSLLPNAVAKMIGRFVSHPKSDIASDSLYLPRIHCNGVPVYDSVDKASKYLAINKIVSKVAPTSILFLVPGPASSLLTYSLLFYLYFTTNWKTVRHLVLKLELLPHTEEIVYQKVTIWGEISTRKAKISELQLVSLQDVFGEGNHSEKAVRGLINRDVIFRIKGTKELLLFDKQGFWHIEGLNHQLLV